nr:YadA C-terminal domain-containing protein [Paraburkholderia azotifigens]
MGAYSTATTSNSVALGYKSVANSATLSTAGYNPGSGTLSAATAAGEVSVGAAGSERRITNVAAGLNGTDAVNVSQLQSEDAEVNQQGTTTAAALGGGAAYNSTTGVVSAPSYALTNANAIDGTTAKKYTDQQINMVQQGVNSVARNAYSGIAAATALTMIPDVDQGKTIAVGIGSGSYHGYQAAALGASARITENIKVKMGAGISGQGTTVGVGASYQW